MGGGNSLHLKNGKRWVGYLHNLYHLKYASCLSDLKFMKMKVHVKQVYLVF